MTTRVRPINHGPFQRVANASQRRRPDALSCDWVDAGQPTFARPQAPADCAFSAQVSAASWLHFLLKTRAATSAHHPCQSQHNLQSPKKTKARRLRSTSGRIDADCTGQRASMTLPKSTWPAQCEGLDLQRPGSQQTAWHHAAARRPGGSVITSMMQGVKVYHGRFSPKKTTEDERALDSDLDLSSQKI